MADIYFDTLSSETDGVVSTCKVVVTAEAIAVGIITVEDIILFSIKYILHNKKI